VEIVMSTAALRHQASSKAESISRVTRRLQQQFPELEAETVEAVVNERYHMFDGRPIRVFIPSWSNTRLRTSQWPSSFDGMTHPAPRRR
jgi:hypothetical protein